MKAKLKFYSVIVLISIFLFSCDNKQTKSTEVNTTKSKDTISTVKSISIIKRKPDLTKIAFGDIEFGMSIQDLLITQTFKSMSSKDLRIGCFNDSYVMKNIFESNNIPESLLIQENIIRNNNIQTIEIIDKIGLFKYNVKAILVKNSMSLIQINSSNENDGLENIVNVITLKYGPSIKHKTKDLILTKKGQEIKNERNKSSVLQFDNYIFSNDCKEIPRPYCLHEWKLKNKRIKVFSFYQQMDYPGRETNSLRGWKVVNNYLVEIYSDKVLSNIVNNFKSTLTSIENNRNKVKAKDSEKF